MLEGLKRRIYDVIEKKPAVDSLSRAFSIFITLLIILNVIAVSLETVEEYYIDLKLYFEYFEIFSVIIFTIEYGLRLFSCTTNEVYAKPITGRIRYALTPLALVDLLAILPFYLPFLIPIDLRFLRALRLARLLRIFKMGRYSEALKTFTAVLTRKRGDIFIVLIVIFMLLIVTSGVMYYAESEAQPEVFSSIPHAMWWGVITLTTVGYGDVYPITPLGKVFATVIAILGIGMFALPAGILGSGFIEEIQRRKTGAAFICPFCGREVDSAVSGNASSRYAIRD